MYVTVLLLSCTVVPSACELWSCVELQEGDRRKSGVFLNDMSCSQRVLHTYPRHIFSASRYRHQVSAIMYVCTLLHYTHASSSLFNMQYQMDRYRVRLEAVSKCGTTVALEVQVGSAVQHQSNTCALPGTETESVLSYRSNDTERNVTLSALFD